MKTLKVSAVLAVLAAPAFAEGDAAAGAEAFDRQCVSCHMIADGDNVIAGRGKTGPNLFGLSGKTVGTTEGFNYGDAIVAAGAAGTVWTEEAFVPYVQDPTNWLRETTGDKKARSKMSFKVRSEEDAENLWAYLSTFN